MLRSVAAVAALLLISACSKHTEPATATKLRLGYFPNLTHAAALVGLERGDFARALAPVTVEPKPFNAGPEAMEAIFAGALDVTYVGPMPALNGYLRSQGRAAVVVAGAAEGGAALVARNESHISGPADLHGRRIGTPQLANTQDVALRAYLKKNGLVPRERGGDVQVVPTANPELLSLMKRGQLDAAWVPEPWATRMLHEAEAHIVIEDREFWPGMPTAVVVVSRPFLDANPDLVRRFVAAHAAVLAWINQNPDEAQRLAAQAITKSGGKPLPPEQLAEAWRRVVFSADPHAAQIAAFADEARALGYLPPGDASGLVERRFAAQGTAP
jgi:NitT/TauT family transport system substrate-binding protein